jgi:hypothetical protein
LAFKAHETELDQGVDKACLILWIETAIDTSELDRNPGLFSGWVFEGYEDAKTALTGGGISAPFRWRSNSYAVLRRSPLTRSSAPRMQSARQMLGRSVDTGIHGVESLGMG